MNAVRRLPAALLAVLALLLLTAVTAAATVSLRANLRPSYGKDGLLVILAIGSDIGPPHRPGDPLRGRADGIHLIAVDTVAKRATIVNFPRDSLVGGRKVNAYLTIGGPQRLEAELEAFTGIPIDFWALTSFRSIENIVDGMDGVDVVVDQRMLDAFSGSDFHPGPRELRGHQALAYVRDRNSVVGGDIGRSRHHGDLMRYAHIQIVTHQSDLPTLVRLTALFARNTVTNIPPHELLQLAVLATQIDPANVRQVPLTGAVGFSGAASIVRLAPGSTFEEIRAGRVGP